MHKSRPAPKPVTRIVEGIRVALVQRLVDRDLQISSGKRHIITWRMRIYIWQDVSFRLEPCEVRPAKHDEERMWSSESRLHGSRMM